MCDNQPLGVLHDILGYAEYVHAGGVAGKNAIRPAMVGKDFIKVVLCFFIFEDNLHHKVKLGGFFWNLAV